MNSKKNIKIILLTSVIVSLFWSAILIIACYQKYNLQKYIDGEFSVHFISLHSELFGLNYQLMDSETLQDYCVSMQSDALLCATLLPISSHSENQSLKNIILTLSDWAKDPLFYSEIDKDLFGDLGYLSLHLDSVELSDEVWSKLESLG